MNLLRKLLTALCALLLFSHSALAIAPLSLPETIEMLEGRPVNVAALGNIDDASLSLGKKDAKVVTLEGTQLTPKKPGKATLTAKRGDEQVRVNVRVYSEKDAAKEILALVNAARKKAGMKALKLSDSLSKAAKTRAAELEHLFSHDRPNGKAYFTSFDEVKANFSYKGENIAAGQSGPIHVMRDWLNSPSHYQTIVFNKFTYMGAAFVILDSGAICWAQEFGGK